MKLFHIALIATTTSTISCASAPTTTPTAPAFGQLFASGDYDRAMSQCQVAVPADRIAPCVEIWMGLGQPGRAVEMLGRSEGDDHALAMGTLRMALRGASAEGLSPETKRRLQRTHDGAIALQVLGGTLPPLGLHATDVARDVREARLEVLAILRDARSPPDMLGRALIRLGLMTKKGFREGVFNNATLPAPPMAVPADRDARDLAVKLTVLGYLSDPAAAAEHLLDSPPVVPSVGLLQASMIDLRIPASPFDGLGVVLIFVVLALGPRPGRSGGRPHVRWTDVFRRFAGVLALALVIGPAALSGQAVSSVIESANAALDQAETARAGATEEFKAMVSQLAQLKREGKITPEQAQLEGLAAITSWLEAEKQYTNQYSRIVTELEGRLDRAAIGTSDQIERLESAVETLSDRMVENTRRMDGLVGSTILDGEIAAVTGMPMPGYSAGALAWRERLQSGLTSFRGRLDALRENLTVAVLNIEEVRDLTSEARALNAEYSVTLDDLAAAIEPLLDLDPSLLAGELPGIFQGPHPFTAADVVFSEAMPLLFPTAGGSTSRKAATAPDLDALRARYAAQDTTRHREE